DASYVMFCENLAVRLVDKNAMRGHDIGAEYSDFVQILHRGHSILLLAVVPLLLHLSHMNKDRRVIPACQRSRILECFPGAGVNRMRSGRGMDQRIALPLLQELLGVGE